jgi:hypothetical protein
MSRYMGKLLSMFGVFVILTIGSVYMFGVMGAESDSVNVSGTAYENTYNSSMKIQNTSMGLIGPLGLLVFVAVIVIAAKGLKGR